MIIIFLIITTFISVSIDYIWKVKHTQKTEENIFKEAIRYRKNSFRLNIPDLTW